MFMLLSSSTLVLLMMSGMADSSCNPSSCSNNEICQSCFNNGGLCEKTQDPLYCSNLLASGKQCFFQGEPCDSKTNLSYGCHNNACYSQCVGAKFGDNEWCWIMPRARGVVAPEISCSQSSDCSPETHTFKCSNSCN